MDNGHDNLNLYGELDDLVKETSLVIEENEKTEGEAMDVDGGQGRATSPAMADLKRVMALLEQKEADLELAAKIGDALFQENTRLRKETEGMDGLRGKLEAKEDEIISLKEQLRTIQKRNDLLAEHLGEADVTNKKLMDKIERLERGSQRRLSVDDDDAYADGDASEQRYQGNGSSKNSKTMSPGRVSTTSNADEEEENQIRVDLELANESLENWRKRALAAEKRVETVRNDHIEKIEEFMNTIASLEDELGNFKARAKQKQMDEAQQKSASESQQAVLSEMSKLKEQVKALERENHTLILDLDEYKALLGEANRPRTSSESSLSNQKVDSLEAELANAGLGDTSTDNVVETTEQPKDNNAEEDLDPILFFHFNMTLMSCKASISKRRIEKSVLDTINAMDSKEMYKKVMEEGIPPHHWIGYIYDCFSREHLKSLARKRRNGPMNTLLPSQGASIGAGIPSGEVSSMLFDESQGYLAALEGTSNSSASSSTTPKKPSKSYFSRLMSSVAISSPNKKNQTEKPTSSRLSASDETTV